MIYPRPWPPVALALLALSLIIHLASVALYTRLPARFAAITVFPIWVWGFIGLGLAVSAFIFYRARLSLILTALWAFTLLLLADEARPLARLTKTPLPVAPPAPHFDTPVIRVITQNCAGLVNPTETFAPFQPDILFLQEITQPYLLKNLVETLFDGKGDYRYDIRKQCAVAIRGTFTDEFPMPEYRSQLLTAELHDGRPIILLNLHLRSAATNLRLFTRKCWQEHSENRYLRQVELAYAIAALQQKTSYPNIPAFIAGDFNAPANDVVHRFLEKDFNNAFNLSGTGWPNTFHRALPLLRIDHIYASPSLLPVRSRVFLQTTSDHRFVVADFVYR